MEAMTASIYFTLQYMATHNNILQHTATHCNALQHTRLQSHAMYTYIHTLHVLGYSLGALFSFSPSLRLFLSPFLSSFLYFFFSLSVCLSVCLSICLSNSLSLALLPPVSLAHLLEAVYLVTALVPSDTACLASSPGRTSRVAV